MKSEQTVGAAGIVFRFPNWLKTTVITGGPCGGKSTFMRMAVTHLKKQGFIVIVVPEAARELRAAGFHPVRSPWKSRTSFQDLVFRAILEREKLYMESLRDMDIEGKQVVFLCDRGLADGGAYVTDAEFDALLAELGTSKAEIIDRYTGVISLTSAAHGAEDFYVNDDEREEGLAEACMLDDRTVAAWHQHQHLSIVDNSTGFDEKMNRALLALNRLLHMPMPTEIEKKYRVDNFSPDQIPAGTKMYAIEQYYLTRIEKPGIECRLRVKTTNGVNSYYYTEKTPTKTEGVRGEFEESISEEQFFELMRYRDNKCRPVIKTRHKIQYGSYILELDVYGQSLAGLVILEAEFSSEADMHAFIPPDYFRLTDVTADKAYSNAGLARKGIPESAKMAKAVDAGVK